MNKIPITVAYGDGIGPEIMEATLRILEAAGAKLEIHKVEIGEKVYLNGHPTGIEDSTWDTIRQTKAFLKAPITTPQGGGFKSLNVTIRTTLGLYANVRPCISYYPFITTKHPNMDLVIVRENEEDLYCGIEYQQTPNVAHSVKIISREGSEKIIRYAFEYALANNRRKVTCFTKDNIMKLSDGLFHKVFDEISKEYPTLEKEHWIVDIGSAKMADAPELFDVIVMPNLYGDILSDIAAEISGSVGIAGSANIGPTCAMFEAIHGSAPRRAGQNLANPSGLLFAAIQMLVHIDQEDIATKINNAWLKTIEEGIHTYDIFNEKTSSKKVGTKEFAQAIIDRLGQMPSTLKAVTFHKQKHSINQTSLKPVERKLVGVDLYLYHQGALEAIQSKLLSLGEKIPLKEIYNRGVRVFPKGHKETACIEQWRARFLAQKPLLPEDISKLIQSAISSDLDVIKTEFLFNINGVPGYSV